MNQYPSLRRALAAAGALAIMGVVVVLAATSHRPAEEQPAKPDPKLYPHPMWGGTPSRNQVNLLDKNVLTQWDVTKKTNILWTADLGSKAYGGPAVGDGKIFVGTNNEKPRDPKVKGDKGIVMCFEEATGKFLWQIVHDKLPAGRVNDWPEEGICSAPVCEGNYIYYVNNRCEVDCVDVSGPAPKSSGGWT